jgi:hypothetical protein
MSPIDYFMAIFTDVCFGLAGIAANLASHFDPMMMTLVTGAFAFGLILIIGSAFFWRRMRSHAALLDSIVDRQSPQVHSVNRQ